MFDKPMFCPNPIHEKDPNPQSGMNIIPKGTRQWYCLDCNELFIRKYGISKLIS